MRILLVANPTAQTGKASARVDEVMAAMGARGWLCALCATEAGGRTVRKLARFLDSAAPDELFDRVVYMGGDGTFREAATGILGASFPAPLGMLPSGTANDQGKSFGISAEPAALEENLDLIEAGHLTHLDVGEIRRLDDDGRPTHETLFFDSAGFGWQAEILEQRNHDRAKVAKVPLLRDLYRDQAVYAGAVVEKYVKSFTRNPKMDAEVVIDGDALVHYENVLDVVVKNTAIYGGAWVLDRRNEPDDGKMELVPFAGRRDWASKALRDLKDVPIWQEHLDELGVTHADSRQGSRFRLTLQPNAGGECATQLDGEEWLRGRRFVVSVYPRALPLITRDDWTPPWAAGA
jgi:diacylglycerol kinase family enzyme